MRSSRSTAFKAFKIFGAFKIQNWSIQKQCQQVLLYLHHSKYTFLALYTTIGDKYWLSALPQTILLIACFECLVFLSTRRRLLRTSNFCCRVICDVCFIIIAYSCRENCLLVILLSFFHMIKVSIHNFRRNLC